MGTTDTWMALGDATRRGILARVAQAPSSVTNLARALPISRPAVSQHLQILYAAGLVDVRPHGRERIYTARLDGLDSLRRELETFWNHALANFKRIAEADHDHQHSTEDE